MRKVYVARYSLIVTLFMVSSDYTIHHCQPVWRTLPGMAARLVLNSVVQGRGSTACTRLGFNRSMVSVKVRLGIVHVHVFWGSVSVNRSSALSMIYLSFLSIKSSSSLSSSLSGVIVSVISSTVSTTISSLTM